MHMWSGRKECHTIQGVSHRKTQKTCFLFGRLKYHKFIISPFKSIESSASGPKNATAIQMYIIIDIAAGIAYPIKCSLMIDFAKR